MSANPTPYDAHVSRDGRKVAIPRLQRPGPPSAARDRKRVSRACTACRNQKIKCTGDQPSCKHCEATSRECIYILPRRDRLKIVTDRCLQLAAMLQSIRHRAEEDEGAKIGELLSAAEEDIGDIRHVVATSNADTDLDDFRTAIDGTTELLDPVDTTSLDLLDENLERDERAQATGFVGKNSAVQWLRSVVTQFDKRDDDSMSSMFERRGSYASGHVNVEQVSSFNFYLDSDSVDLGADYFVTKDGLPPPDLAILLLQCYWSTVHSSFPILPVEALEKFQKHLHATKQGNATSLNPKWASILNLVLAIGAKYSHIIKAEWRAHERDHLIYQARGRMLGLDGTAALTSHPDLPQIQVTGLLAFYYLSVGQISRSWILTGAALRFAYALGLHVRNEDPTAAPTKKEMRVRTWWSLYSLERLLSIISGRPSVIVDGCCSVPLPLPVFEEQLSDNVEEMDQLRRDHSTTPSTTPTTTQVFADVVPSPKLSPNPGSYFRAVVQMGIITQEILTSLYSVGTMIRTGDGIAQDINQLNLRLEHWLGTLPPDFNFQGSYTASYRRERLILGFHFYSAKIVLTCPCLRGLSHAGRDQIVPESFRRQMANACIEAARQVVGFLPDQPDHLSLYENGPWWSVVHSLMQAFSVLLLALSQSSPASHDCIALSQCTTKLVRWLRALQDPLAERAYRMAMRTLNVVAGRNSLDFSDLWLEDRMAFSTAGAASRSAGDQRTTGAEMPRFHASYVTDAAEAMGAPVFLGMEPYAPSLYPPHSAEP